MGQLIHDGKLLFKTAVVHMDGVELPLSSSATWHAAAAVLESAAVSMK